MRDTGPKSGGKITEIQGPLAGRLPALDFAMEDLLQTRSPEQLYDLKSRIDQVLEKHRAESRSIEEILPKLSPLEIAELGRIARELLGGAEESSPSSAAQPKRGSLDVSSRYSPSGSASPGIGQGVGASQSASARAPAGASTGIAKDFKALLLAMLRDPSHAASAQALSKEASASAVLALDSSGDLLRQGLRMYPDRPPGVEKDLRQSYLLLEEAAESDAPRLIDKHTTFLGSRRTSMAYAKKPRDARQQELANKFMPGHRAVTLNNLAECQSALRDLCKVELSPDGTSVSFVVPKQKTPHQVLEWAQQVTRAMYNRDAIAPGVLYSWSKERGFLEQSEIQVRIEVRLKPRSNLTSRTVHSNANLNNVRKSELAIAHALFTALTGDDFFDGVIVRCAGGELEALTGELRPGCPDFDEGEREAVFACFNPRRPSVFK